MKIFSMRDTLEIDDSSNIETIKKSIHVKYKYPIDSILIRKYKDRYFLFFERSNKHQQENAEQVHENIFKSLGKFKVIKDFLKNREHEKLNIELDDDKFNKLIANNVDDYINAMFDDEP